MKQKLTMAGVILFVFFMVGYAFAYNMGGHKGMGKYNQLSAEEQKSFDAIVDKYEADLTKLHKQLRLEHLKLETLILDEKSSDADIKSQTEKVNNLQSQIFTKKTLMRKELSQKGFDRIMGMGMGGMNCPMMCGGKGGMMGGMQGGMMDGGMGRGMGNQNDNNPHNNH